MQRIRIWAIVHFTILTGLFLLLACSNSGPSGEAPGNEKDPSQELLSWFEENGQYINSDKVPSIMDARVVYSMREENIHIIDLRKPGDFQEAHIEHAVNLDASQVLTYFKESIQAAQFSHIFLVCYDLNISGYVSGVLRLLGYDNVFAMRFGMSGWDKAIAEEYWLSSVGNFMVGIMDTTGYPRHPAGAYPSLASNSNNGFDIAMERATEILQLPLEDYIITISELLKSPDSYYTICYWPEEKYYSNGHLPGAIQYTPKQSLGRDQYLNTLPLDKPVVVYCYSGQHSTFVAAYLRMLGYDARSLAYGANGFIHEVMAKTEPRPSRTFTEDLIQNLPLIRGEEDQKAAEPSGISEEKITVEGGC
jgi:rhodanese-related sulfurtransferase